MIIQHATSLCIIFVLVSTVKQISSQDPLLKNIEKGQIRGRYQYSRDDRQFLSFENIRFAKQPVRFQPPVEPDVWDQIHDATKPGFKCPQMPQFGGTFSDQSEDCLNLNVFVPAELESYKNLTVMFYIHGGGYTGGSGLEMGPRYFMDEDVVLVTTNYRLGAFGFLNSGDELVRGNMGFKDMIMALKWVQSNIHVFGGDPSQVTIFGESAGAAAVHSLMLSPAAKGLFHKVIAQSGSALAPWNTAEKPAETFKHLAQSLSCTGSENAELLKCLGEKSFSDIVGAFAVGPFSASIDPAPISGDYSVFPEPFEKLIENGDNSKHLPLIIGRNDVEWRGTAVGSLQDPSFIELLNTNWTAGLLRVADLSRFVHPNDSVARVGEAIREFYFNGRTSVANDPETAESLEQMLTDLNFLWNIKNSVILGTKYGGKVYAYTFMYQGNFSLADNSEGRKRPSHADDLQYLFQSLLKPNLNWPDLEPGSEDEEFSKKFISLWVSFARSGDSVPDSTILGGEWNPIPKEKATLDSTIEWYLIQENAVSQLETERLRDRIRFWNNIFEFSLKTIEKGPIMGRYQFSRENRKFASFENIPFAKQPVRFQPPVEPDVWGDQIHDATKPGYKCPQMPQFGGTFSDQSEDCLNLNVFVPAEMESYSNLTVMFWIHGGGYTSGSGLEMGPRYFMDEDVVLVTTNYRLGAFGFLNSGDELVRGNMGFKDMIMALKWVQSNIHVFGGDPSQVTVFGESAGAAAVHSLMLSPAAKGLFHKVIAQSGSALAPFNTAEKPAETFKRLAESLSCTGSDNSMLLECMGEKSFSDIVGAFAVGPFCASIDPAPISGDYSVFPEAFEKLIENGDNSRHVPLIMGRNDVEWRGAAVGSLQDPSLIELLNTNWTAGLLRMADLSRFVHPNDSVARVGEAIREFYFNGRTSVANDPETAESLEQMLTDLNFLWNIKNSVILGTKYGGKVYAYTFMYQGNFSLADNSEGRKRPSHADDLQYLFQSLLKPNLNWPDLEPGSEDEEFSKKFISLWVSFARSEDSVPDSTILGGEWNPIPKEKATLDSTIEWYLIQENAVSQLETERLRDRIRFWNNIFEFSMKTIEKGQIRGRYQFSREDRKFASFENIPFAKQPVRFQPPVEPDVWGDQIHDATKPGYKCPQMPQPTRTFSDLSEDCLNLNVFVPAELESDTNLTVMFWVHGGAYIGGSGLEMGPSYFMDEDVVLVTTNYRLGAFGLLNSGDELVRGNMGFKDMIMALKWVQSNIHVFGGNPSQVTLFGESAGAAAVHSLMLSPAAKGLFHKVIVQSGSALAHWNTAYKPAETFKHLAESLNCTGSENAELLKCLGEKSFLEILEAPVSFALGPPFSASIDPAPNSGDYSVFPEPFEKLIENGDNSKHLPLIMGRNDVEWRGTAVGSLQDDSFIELINTNWTAGLLRVADFSRFVHPNDSVARVGAAIRDFYFNGRTSVANDPESAESLEQMLTDFDFLRNIKNSVILGTKYGGKVYAYTFMYQGNFSLSDNSEGRKRPSHADDLQYLFQSLLKPNLNWPDLEPGSEDEEFSKKFVSLWVSFARSEDSVPDSTILGGEWNPIPKEKATLDSTIEWYLIQEDAVSQLETERLRDRVKFWNHVFDYSSALRLSSSFVISIIIIAGIAVSSFLS